jgi:SAM-dependent methyltransferase
MGVEYYTSRFLLQARARGHNFGRVLTIARQNLLISPRDVEKLGREFGFAPEELTKTQPPSALTYVEPLFTTLLKAAEVESIDASPYEGATHLHDMNLPLPEQFRSRYDTVLEAGSLEHIFNFPTAIKNLMEAVKPGGSIFIQTPANNYFGHGFYQFSPELFYRVFNAENGFEVRRLELFEHLYPCHIFATPTHTVADPAVVGKRVQLVNNRPTLLLVEARRTAEKPIFATTPQQSDYVPMWQANKPVMATPSRTPMVLKRRSKHLYSSLPLWLVGRLWLQYLTRSDKPALSNREFFKPAR